MLLILKCSNAAFCFNSFCCTFAINCLCDVILRIETLFQRRIALVWNVLQPETLLYLGRTTLPDIISWDPGGVLPYMGYIGMCGPKGYGFSAVLVINRVSIIAILPPLWS